MEFALDPEGEREKIGSRDPKILQTKTKENKTKWGIDLIGKFIFILTNNDEF